MEILIEIILSLLILFAPGKIGLYMYIGLMLVFIVWVLIGESKNKNDRKRLLTALRLLVISNVLLIIDNFLESPIIKPSSTKPFFTNRNIMMMIGLLVCGILLIVVKRNMSKQKKPE